MKSKEICQHHKAFQQEELGSVRPSQSYGGWMDGRMDWILLRKLVLLEYHAMLKLNNIEYKNIKLLFVKYSNIR